MVSKTLTQRICHHLRELRERHPDLTLEYVEAWTRENGYPISRQAISRALNNNVIRMQKKTARMLARFIEAETRGEIRADALLDHDAGTPAEHMARLLQKADQTATLSGWREALNACLEALDIARSLHDSEHLCAINERIGTLYLLYTESTDVARGYYETALKHAQTPDHRCRLHCRLVRCAHTRWAIHHLHQARRLLPACQEPALPAWVAAIEADFWVNDCDFERAETLAQRALQNPALPMDVQYDAHRVLLCLAGIHQNSARILELERRLPRPDTETYASLRYRAALQSAYWECGRLPDALRVLREAEAIYRKHGRYFEADGMRIRQGHGAQLMGDTTQARLLLTSASQTHPNDLYLYFCLCKTCLASPHPDSLRWARHLLRLICDQILADLPYGTPSAPHPNDGYPFGKLLHRLGLTERLFRDAGKSAAFRKRISMLSDTLIAHGVADRITYFFEDPVALREIPPIDATEWHFEPGSAHGHLKTRNDEHILSTRPLLGFNQFTMPRICHRVSGDFILQATTHGAQSVIPDLLNAQAGTGNGCRATQAAGSGGLCVLVDDKTFCRLFAHMQSPAEILFEVCQKGKNETIGRGLLEDSDIRLRIERHHNILRAYAGNVDGPWYLAGETDFPGGEVTIGFHGEAIVDTYSITNRCIVRFRDIRFEGYPVE